jgi:hypothetical protein
MKEIIDLNKWLLKHPARVLAAGEILLERNDQESELQRLPGECRERIRLLCGELELQIPSDFNYLLRLGFGEPELVLARAAGIHFDFFGPDWIEDRSIFPQLADADWDSMRKDANAACAASLLELQGNN